MALPTLPSFLELKKVNFNQELLRNKHANEFDNMEKWSNTRKYFQTTNNLSNQHTNWTSDKSFNTSMFAYSQQQENSEAKLTERLQKMSERRSKLRALLDREKITQEAELKSMRTAPVGHVGASVPGVPSGNIGSGGIPATLEVLRNRAEALKSAKEESRRKLAEQKLYENWRSNHPELRELESKKMEEHVVGAWSEQLKEKSELAKAEKRQDEEYLAYLEAERQRQEDRDEELRRLKLSREVELKELLKQQMIELRQREAETEVCKREELSLAKQRDDIDMLLEERRQIAQRSQKEEYGRQLLRQHKAKLRQRARQVQEELEFDMKILAAMNESKLEERYAESARKEQARADSQKMLQVLNEQLRLEKIREAELDAMFADEAAREWEKRAVEWEKEREAREQLMRQVMQERAMQLGEKSSLLAEKKAESLQKRAELLRDMELTQVMLKREKEKTELAKQDRRKELDKAVEEMGLESRLKDEIANDVGQIEMERMELNDADKMLDVEKAKIVDEPFKPKSFGRKKVAWT